MKHHTIQQTNTGNSKHPSAGYRRPSKSSFIWGARPSARIVCWLLSLLVHALIVLSSFQLTDFGLEQTPRKVYTVDIVAKKKVQPRQTTSPKSETQAKPGQKALPRQEPSPPPAPKPQPEPSKQARKKAAPPPPEEKSKPSKPVTMSQDRVIVPPGTEAISPQKRKGAPEPEVSDKPIIIRQGNPIWLPDSKEYITLKGKAGFTPLRALAVRNFTEDEYVGLYKIGASRFVNIIDGRETSKRMYIYDSKGQLLRTLSKYGGMIYTYGPEIGTPKPVKGSLIFLASKEHRQDVPLPSRIMYIPEDQISQMARMEYFPEKDRPFRSQASTYTGRLVLPVDKKNVPLIIFVLGDSCYPHALFTSFARSLAYRGIAAFAFQPMDCKHTDQANPEQTQKQLLKGIQAAYNTVQRVWEIDEKRVGIWGMDSVGASAAIASVSQPENQFAFLILSLFQPLHRRDAILSGLSGIRNISGVPIQLLFSKQNADLGLKELSFPAGKNEITSETLNTVLVEDDPWITRMHPRSTPAVSRWVKSLPSN